jgi:protein-S-isoprenylcysteine O-methyltransferase Ste14
MTEKDYILIGYAILILIGRGFAHNQRKANSNINQVKLIFNDPTAIFVAFSAIVAFAMPLIESLKKTSYTVNWMPIISGGIFILIGWLVVYFSNKTIAENWSPIIDKTQDQELIKEGIYSIVRHPLYFSGILILSGTNLYFQNTWSWLAVLLVFIVTLYRIPMEDKRLEERFGKEFIAYKEQTKSLIPWIL